MAGTSDTDSLRKIRESVKSRFEQSKRLLTFEEYLDLVQRNPYPYLRTATQYTLDALEQGGTREIPIRDHQEVRYRLFDGPTVQDPPRVVGHESVQQAFVKILRGFQRTGRSNKLIVLHGPNGSAKSSFVRALFEGLERYSSIDEGSLFSFSWIFPHESFERTGLGFGAKRESGSSAELESFAKLDQEKIGAILRSETHENPITFIPLADRKLLFEEWMGRARDSQERERLDSIRDSFLTSELSHKSSLIFDALLNDYKGDIRKVLRHVRVERFYFSKRLRKALVTIEPQLSVDAHLRQVTLDRSLAHLPPALQSLNLFQLEGDLIDGNRGVIEYNDILKRPPEHFKYLLGTCETGSVTLAHVMAFLDTVFVATTNDRQLEAFREYPDFNSFKARMELIRVPYLLRFSDEEQIYQETAKLSAGTKELMPHTTRVLALWAILTRLKRPLLKNKSSLLASVLERLTPLEKAKLYDSGTLPTHLTEEERRELRGHVEELIEEQQHQPYYEGLMGASARELKVALQMAAQNDEFLTFGPSAVFHELQALVRRPMDFDYLRIEANQGYHDFEALIQVVRKEWLDWVDHEVMTCLSLQRRSQIEDFLAKYLMQVTLFIRQETTKNRITGQAEGADETLLQEFEGYLQVSEEGRHEFRRNLVSRLGAWSIENSQRLQGQTPPYAQIFPELLTKVHNRFREEDLIKLKAMGAAILDVSTFDRLLEEPGDAAKLGEGPALATMAYQGLQTKFYYGRLGAKEALVALVRDRYV